MKNVQLSVCVRKRPLSGKEIKAQIIDCITVANPYIKVLTPKVKVDGITKYIEELEFAFDNSFGCNEDTDTIYDCTIKSSLESIFLGGNLTIFAYGQTGSGKTFTMKQLTSLSVRGLFDLKLQRFNNVKFSISFIEIYGGKCLDLFAQKKKVEVLEDHENNVVIQNLTEIEVPNSDQMETLI